ncbi:MAG TPA: 2OG-Fe(II) oxygenase [Pyrinomonadaceae bacterium]|nr:2OG-Fe(II) oxygenase [Pyrinomonadaceae bacterium]
MIEDFFEPLVRDRLVAELNAAAGSSSIVYGSSQSGTVDQTSRRSLRLTPPAETAQLVARKLLDCMDRIAARFEVELSECEEPQFLRYRMGDFFVAHQDGNTGLLRLDTERRRVSTVIFLGREADAPDAGPNVYCGGSLVFTNLNAPPESAKFRLRADPGTLIAFRSETTHEVTPVTHGERLSIVSWYR